MIVGGPNSDQYQEHNVDQYRVYLFKDAKTRDRLVIDTFGFSFFRKLTVSGLLI